MLPGRHVCVSGRLRRSRGVGLEYCPNGLVANILAVLTRLFMANRKEPAAERSIEQAIQNFNKKFNELQDEEIETYTLKDNHETKPFWVSNRGDIILEAFHEHYKVAYEFVIAIAEPVSRTEFIHEYAITQTSLLGASAYNLSAREVLKYLELYSKNVVPPMVLIRVNHVMKRYGKVKLVIKDAKFFVESAEASVLHELLRNPDVRAARKGGSGSGFIKTMVQKDDRSYLTEGERHLRGLQAGGGKHTDSTPTESILERARRLQELEDEVEKGVEGNKLLFENYAMSRMYSFQIDQARVNAVRQAAMWLDMEGGYPILKEYDYLNDLKSPNLNILPKVMFKPRHYQTRALGKMFGNQRAKSGIIVLPCGAGKTFTGISACINVNKSCLVIVTNNVSVEQWKKEFLKFSTISERQVFRLTSKAKEVFDEKKACVCITTYSMMGFSDKKRGAESRRAMERLQSVDWGLMLLDEVHIAPATVFRKVLQRVRALTILGLTATLVREDDLIEDLNFLIGPKLYEANWMDLTDQGHLARVLCKEVWCPMTMPFFQEYLDLQNFRDKKSEEGVHYNKPFRTQQRLYVMNPNKLLICYKLLELHKQRNEKILVFSDDIFALKHYSRVLGVPMIYGKSNSEERLARISQFKMSRTSEVLLISKIGDTSIDLPECQVIIQISSHGGSRRQEAQRLGRVIRPKPGQDPGNKEPNAFFYSLISKGTREDYHNKNRQRYLQDQGYPYTVLDGELMFLKNPNIDFNDAPPGVKEMATDKRARNDLLELVLTAAIDENEVGGDVDGFDADDWKEDYSGNKRGGKKRAREAARRSTHRSLNRMSDVDGNLQYYEKARKPTAPTANFLTARR